MQLQLSEIIFVLFRKWTPEIHLSASDKSHSVIASQLWRKACWKDTATFICMVNEKIKGSNIQAMAVQLAQRLML